MLVLAIFILYVIVTFAVVVNVWRPSVRVALLVELLLVSLGGAVLLRYGPVPRK